MNIRKQYFSKLASVQQLSNVKLVLGNGFDLFCGIKSSYKDFFETKKEDFNIYQKHIETKRIDYNNFDFLADNPNAFDGITIDKKQLNMWMAFFAFESNDQTDYRWCDIETMMSDSLFDCWPRVFELVEEEYDYEGEREGEFKHTYLAALAYLLNNNTFFKTEEDFYEFLLNQLKVFERSFVKYIARNHSCGIYDSYGVYNHNNIFTDNCRLVLSFLCDLKRVVSIETFNFDETDYEDVDCLFHHINGDLNNPIFGVDTESFKPYDPRFIFTKLCRRMNNDMSSQEGFKKIHFENAIIFGHSLHRHDYSYFFPLLDKLNITSLEADNKIVFAFSIYDINKKDAILKEQRKAIFDLFKAYSSYKGAETEPERLLDFLTTQGRIIMYQLPIPPVEHNLDLSQNYFATKRLNSNN